MAPFAANAGALLNASGSQQPVSKAEMQHLVDSLRSILEIAEESISSASSHPNDLLGYLQDHTAEGNRFRTGIEDLKSLVDKAQWIDFLNFMELRAKEIPYPKNLYRAHNHGYRFPRFVDQDTGEYCDSFGSDLHLWSEYDAGMEIYIPMCDPTEELTVDDVFRELSQHLNLTQINRQRKVNDEEPFLSWFVSLSGDFHWTTQRACRIGKTARGNQIPGLALFETSMVKADGVHIWRVRDMLEFFDNSKAKSSVIISPDLRRWAANADEYVCWELVPRKALVAFIPSRELTQKFDSGDKAFLRKDFVNSIDLSDFRRRPLERLSLEEYAGRASSFMHKIVTNVSPWMEVGQLDTNRLGNWLLNPFNWGYDVTAFYEDLEEKIMSSIEAALEKGFPDNALG